MAAEHHYPPKGSHWNPELQVSDGSLSKSVLPIVQHQGGMSDKHRAEAVGVAFLASVPEKEIQFHRTRHSHAPHDSTLTVLSNK